MTDRDLFIYLIPAAKKRGIISDKVVYVGDKSKLLIHQIINFILNIFYPKSKKDSYLTNYWTTLGYTITSPKNRVDLDAWETLIHELFHTIQAHRWTRVLFGVLYLWPISLGILLLFLAWLPVFWASGWELVFWSVGWLVVSFLFFIPQLPDYWRSRWELEAYSATMCCMILKGLVVDTDYIDHLVDNFCSMSYGKMMCDRNKAKEIIDKTAMAVISGRHPIWSHPLIKLVCELKSIA